MKIKFVIMFAIVFVLTFIVAVPLHANFKEYNIDEAVEALSVTTYRLPNNTRPLHYLLRVNTWIHRGEFSFNGEVRINIIVEEASRTITLDARQILILELYLLNLDGSIFDSDLRFTYDSGTEFLTIIANRDLEVGLEIAVDIWYVGFLGQYPDRGFFRSSYVDPNTNETHWFATTQFLPINARQAYPCYDEIRYRTPYDLQIFHHRSYNAISNMPVEREDLYEEYQTTFFPTTPPIPTSILSFTVSNFNFVSNNDSDIEVRVYARSHAIAKGQADYGLTLGITFLRVVQDYFNTSFSLPKSDQIAVPELTNDGAYNWGLLTFHERFLLQTSDDANAQHIMEIRSAHEYSHIFFANLVSPVSWAYLWLNEGFATLYENVLNDIVFPDKNQWEQFLIDFFDTSISVDVFDLMPALNQYVESPQEVRGKFDYITYVKSALVLRMFQEAFTESVWKEGVIYYIEEMQYGSATPEDLFAGVQRSYDESFPENNIKVHELMRPWFDYAGFPVITIHRTEEGLVLTQEGFRTSHNHTFSVPINYATASCPNFNETAVDYWLITEELLIPRNISSKSWTDDDWIIVNLRDTGYFLTNYDETLWSLITQAMIHDHEIIHFLNRGTLFADLERFLTHNVDIRATLYLELMESLPFEFHPHVWIRANPGLLKVEQRFRGSQIHSLYLDFLRDIMSVIYSRSSFDDVRATNIVNRWSCVAGFESCLANSLNILLKVMYTGSTIVSIDFHCNGFITANESVWMHFYNDSIQQSPSDDRLNVLSTLLCTNNKELIRFLLDQTLEPSNNMQSFERNSIILTACNQSEVSYNTAVQFIEDRHQTILDQSLDIVAYISMLSSVTNTDSQAEQILNLHRHIPESWNVDLSDFAVIMGPNQLFYRRNYETVRNWFESRNR